MAIVYLTTREAASRLGVTERSVRLYCQSGRLGTRAPGGRGWIITASEVAKFQKMPVGNPLFKPKRKRISAT